MGSILKEIWIFEAGQYSGRKATSVSTTNSFYLATNRGTTIDKPKMDLTCVFCKGMYKPNLCNMTSYPKECFAIIKIAGLCFNCLGHYKVSQCPSRFKCKECHKKHHTSLCQAFTTNIQPSLQTKPDWTVTTAAPTTTATAHNKETPTTVTTTSLSASPWTCVCWNLPSHMFQLGKPL